jgi:transcriptional regulator with XRE-family HTH domain
MNDQTKAWPGMSAANFKAFRKRLNLTQEEFGDQLGISKRTVGLYEANASPVSRTVALACAAVAYNAPPME